MNSSLRVAGFLCVAGRACAVGLALASSACRPDTAAPTTAPPHRTGCTHLRCGPPFIVQIKREGEWPLAQYRVEIDADERQIVCSTTVPLYCDDPPPCDAHNVQLTEIGCGLGTSEHALGAIIFAEVPTQLSVRLYEQGVELAQGTWAPLAQTAHPNGPQCPPACSMAPDVELLLPATTGER